MNYTINNITFNNNILTTNITFTLDNGDIKTIDIAHYLPDVEIGIQNRITNENNNL